MNPLETEGNFITFKTEMKILEETDNKIVVAFKGETHTLLNALRKVANSIKGVKKASYFIDHPLKMNSIFELETDNSIRARDALIEAFKKLKEMLLEFKDWYYQQIE
jgi:DNA-directed RNA polymerase subunit L